MIQRNMMARRRLAFLLCNVKAYIELIFRAWWLMQSLVARFFAGHELRAEAAAHPHATSEIFPGEDKV